MSTSACGVRGGNSFWTVRLTTIQAWLAACGGAVLALASPATAQVKIGPGAGVGAGPIAGPIQDATGLEELGYVDGVDAREALNLHLFGWFNEELDRLDVEPIDAGFTGFTGRNIIDQAFVLRTAAIDAVPEDDPDIDVWAWMGFASAPGGEELAVTGLIASSASLNETRLVTLAVMTRTAGRELMEWLADSTGTDPREPTCILSSAARLEWDVELERALACKRAIVRANATGIVACGAIGMFCFFPATAMIGCVAGISCLLINETCYLERAASLRDEWSTFTRCMCVLDSAGVTDFSRCRFECPDCSLSNPVVPW